MRKMNKVIDYTTDGTFKRRKRNKRGKASFLFYDIYDIGLSSKTGDYPFLTLSFKSNRPIST